SYNGDNTVQHPVVFYPFYPLVARAVASVLNISEAAALLIVSNVAIIVAVPLLFKLIRQSYGDQVAFYAVAGLCFFPSSLFFSAGYTESLALLLIVSFFLLLNKERYVLAALLAGLAVATRSTGLLLSIPLSIEIWRKYSRDPKQLVRVAVPCLLLATSGMWLYMIYLWARFDSPLAFVKGTRAWISGAAIEGGLFGVLTLQPFYHLGEIFKFGPNPNTLSSWFFILFVALLIAFRKRLPFPLWIYSIGALLLPYLTISGDVGFVSFSRYVLMAFPVFIILGELFQRRVWLGLAVIGLFSALLFMYSAFYAQFYWAG
ncbi:MAG TPA: mannosyltransferase family protein, partial [Pyrinomonadaceae bacterium]|nr:mannosyltransferase family protein [Pyrinomonadaceae bacterium]